jgi:hypothetical protein
MPNANIVRYTAEHDKHDPDSYRLQDEDAQQQGHQASLQPQIRGSRADAHSKQEYIESHADQIDREEYGANYLNDSISLDIDRRFQISEKELVSHTSLDTRHAAHQELLQ